MNANFHPDFWKARFNSNSGSMLQVWLIHATQLILEVILAIQYIPGLPLTTFLS